MVAACGTDAIGVGGGVGVAAAECGAVDPAAEACLVDPLQPSASPAAVKAAAARTKARRFTCSVWSLNHRHDGPMKVSAAERHQCSHSAVIDLEQYRAAGRRARLGRSAGAFESWC
jgi:hypothetical protein